MHQKISKIKLCIKIYAVVNSAGFKHRVLYCKFFSSSCTCICRQELWESLGIILQKKFKLWVCSWLSPILRILIIISNALYLTSYLRIFVACFRIFMKGQYFGQLYTVKSWSFDKSSYACKEWIEYFLYGTLLGWVSGAP